MRMLMRVGGVIVGVVAGGTIGGFIGWKLGNFGGRSDPENVWFLSMIVGAKGGMPREGGACLPGTRSPCA